MISPFEDETEPYTVLRNGEGQHSLWPSQNKVPAGWRVVLGPASRMACTEYIESAWLDMRPLSLAQEMAAERCGGG